MLGALLWPLTAGVTAMQYLVYGLAWAAFTLTEYLLWMVVILVDIMGVVFVHTAQFAFSVISAICGAAPDVLTVAGTWLLSACDFLLRFSITAAQFTWSGSSVAAELIWNYTFIIGDVLFDALYFVGIWLIKGVVYTWEFLLAAAEVIWIWLLHVGSHSIHFLSVSAKVIWDAVYVFGGEGLVVCGDFFMSLFTFVGHYLAICLEYMASLPWADTSMTILIGLENFVVLLFTWTVVTPIQYVGWAIYTIFNFIFNLPWLNTVTSAGEFLYTWIIEMPLHYSSVVIRNQDFITVPSLLGIIAVVVVLYALDRFLSKVLQSRQRQVLTPQREQVADAHAPTERQIPRRGSPVRLRTLGSESPTNPIASSDGTTQPHTVSQLREDLERERAKSLCVVCMDVKRELLLKPCNHFCICSNCFRCINNACPVCRRNIIYTEKIYHA